MTTVFTHPFVDGRIVVRAGSDIVANEKLYDEKPARFLRRATKTPRPINVTNAVPRQERRRHDLGDRAGAEHAGASRHAARSVFNAGGAASPASSATTPATKKFTYELELTAAPFAIATRDELWIHGRLVERRLAHGEAIEDERGIRAVDTADAVLVAACDAAMDELRACVTPDARVRLVAEAAARRLTKTIVVTMAGLSVVTTPEHIAGDVALLRSALGVTAGCDESYPRDMPLLWQHGSAAVLLHEAVGHPLEHGQAPARPAVVVDDRRSAATAACVL